MRILSDQVFRDTMQQCQLQECLVYCIVMRTSDRRRKMMENFRRYRDRYNITTFADSVLFKDSKSIIDVKCLADRPSVMYDEILFDYTIDDESAIQKILQFESPREIIDLGDIEPSAEIMEYIRGING